MTSANPRDSRTATERLRDGGAFYVFKITYWRDDINGHAPATKSSLWFRRVEDRSEFARIFHDVGYTSEYHNEQ